MGHNNVIVSLDREDIIRLLKFVEIEFDKDEDVRELWYKYIKWKEEFEENF